MSCDHETCLVITRNVLRSQDMSRSLARSLDRSIARSLGRTASLRIVTSTKTTTRWEDTIDQSSAIPRCATNVVVIVDVVEMQIQLCHQEAQRHAWIRTELHESSKLYGRARPRPQCVHRPGCMLTLPAVCIHVLPENCICVPWLETCMHNQSYTSWMKLASGHHHACTITVTHA